MTSLSARKEKNSSMSVYLNFDVFELYTHTYISCTLCRQHQQTLYTQMSGSEQVRQVPFCENYSEYMGLALHQDLKIGSFGFFFFFFFLFEVVLFLFFDVERGICGISQPLLIKWNLPCCIEPRDLDELAWPQISSSGVDL